MCGGDLNFSNKGLWLLGSCLRRSDEGVGLEDTEPAPALVCDPGRGGAVRAPPIQP